MRAELRDALEDALTDESGEPATEGRFLEGSAADVLAAESAELDLLGVGDLGLGGDAQ